MSPDRGQRVGWRTVLGFAVLAGLLAESFEILRIQSGGIAPPGWTLRAALWVAYGGAAALLFGLATLLGRARALTIAATALVLLVVLPWLNFSYLPRMGSAQSLLGSAVAIALIAVAVPLALRFRRAVAVAIVLVGLVANGWGMIGAGGKAGRTTTAGRTDAPFNVVVVLIDTLRADHLGAYGYERPTSPHFDAYARDAVLFKHAVSQAPWTKPSVASLMTGAFPHKHGVVSSRDALGPELPTLAETMGGRGYRTAAFSANPWITPEFRFDRGFDEFESGRAMGAQLTNLYRLLKRTDRGLKKVGVPTNLASWVFWGSSGNVGNSERDRLLTDGVVDWLGKQGQDPFFLYVHLIGPHDPYDPPADYVKRFRDPAWQGPPGPTVPPARVQTVFEKAAPLEPATQAALIAQYDAAIAYADEQFGRIIEALRASGQLDKSLVVVVADHGEEFYEHGNWRHGNQLYNEVVHVPLAFRLPGRLAAAERPDLAMVVDIFPTVVALVDGKDLAKKGDGRSLFAAQTDPSPTVFSEHWWLDGGTYTAKMVQRGAMKLHDARDQNRDQERAELYNLASDAGEERNLLENPAAVSENGVGELHNLLARFGDKMSVASVSVDVDQSTKERLRQLGY